MCRQHKATNPLRKEISTIILKKKIIVTKKAPRYLYIKASTNDEKFLSIFEILKKFLAIF